LTGIRIKGFTKAIRNYVYAVSIWLAVEAGLEAAATSSIFSGFTSFATTG
jgi:hypothetical protein